MKIYMLNPPFVPRFSRNSRWAARCRGGALYYPIWLASATGLLEKEGHDIRLVDAPAWGWNIDDVKLDIKEFSPDILVTECNFQSLSNDVNVAEALKKEIGATSVLVGPPASQYAERILSGSNDIVARFEYDFTLKDIASYFENEKDLKSLKGISYKADEKIIHNPDRDFLLTEDLDTIPFVSKTYKEHLNIEDYFLGHTLYPMVQIFTGRGCPNQCIFCSWPRTLMGKKHRVRSVVNVVDELEYISKELPEVKEIFIEDDTFTVNKNRIKDICTEILDRKLDIVWSCNSRANLDFESMKLMKRAGCRLLDVGYESGNDDILKNIKKGIKTADSRQFTKNAKKAGLMILADFIFGMPGETKDTAENTIQFVKEIKPNIVQFSVATPIPGTEFYEYTKDNGILLVDDIEKSLSSEGYQKCIISYPDFTKNDIEYYVDRALKSYYLSPSYVPVAMRNVCRKNGLHELRGMITSAKEFFKYVYR